MPLIGENSLPIRSAFFKEPSHSFKKVPVSLRKNCCPQHSFRSKMSLMLPLTHVWTYIYCGMVGTSIYGWPADGQSTLPPDIALDEASLPGTLDESTFIWPPALINTASFAHRQTGEAADEALKPDLRKLVGTSIHEMSEELLLAIFSRADVDTGFKIRR